MKKKHFTRQELRLIKFKLMNKGMNELEASKEIAGMIDCVETNYAIEEKRKKDNEKRYKQGRFKEEFRKFKKIS